MLSAPNLKNYREVGFITVIYPPVTPAKAINAYELKTWLESLFESQNNQVVLDCAGIEYFYSDTLNVIAASLKVLGPRKGMIGILHASDNITKLVEQTFPQKVLVFKTEPNVLAWSMRNPPSVEVIEETFESAEELVENTSVPVEKVDFEKVESKVTEDKPTKTEVLKVELKKEVINELSPLEKAQIEAQEKMAKRRAKLFVEKRQKKRYIFLFSALVLLTLLFGLYLWQKPMIDKMFNDLFAGLF